MEPMIGPLGRVQWIATRQDGPVEAFRRRPRCRRPFSVESAPPRENRLLEFSGTYAVQKSPTSGAGQKRLAQRIRSGRPSGSLTIR